MLGLVIPVPPHVRYVVHGLLHLIGYDDGPIRAAAKMHAREDELLTEFLARSRRRRRGIPQR